ncbi:MAG: hypothetical protein IJ222_01905 [Bacteroidales bacterium]|nr:hypothetical protein [Bacteroidales bacterium]
MKCDFYRIIAVTVTVFALSCAVQHGECTNDYLTKDSGLIIFSKKPNRSTLTFLGIENDQYVYSSFEIIVSKKSQNIYVRKEDGIILSKTPIEDYHCYTASEFAIFEGIESEYKKYTAVNKDFFRLSNNEKKKALERYIEMNTNKTD